jgi:hypothetical protein
LYLNVDLSACADGSILADLAVRNDIVMGATGGPVYTTGSLTQNGIVVYAWSQLYQTQYQAWFVDCGTSPRNCCNVQIDPAYLIKAAVIQPYSLTAGLDASTIEGYQAVTTQTGWLQPLNPNNVDVGMPGTGGRPDIGYETQSAVAALITQDARAIDYCCAQADASGSAPWNYYDMANGCFISTVNYPDIWCDQAGRGGIGQPGNASSSGPTQAPTMTPQSWMLDTAHQPDLSFVPWLYTGRRHYLDQVMSQGAWSIAGEYGRVMTIPGTSTVIQQSLWGGQVRGIAWDLRQVSNAGFCAPDGTSYATYFAEIIAQNATYAAGMQTNLQSQQGACYGYLAQAHGQNNFAPWEQNYLMPICALAGARGYSGWTAIANWFGRFTVESFLPQTDGPYKGAVWNQRNGASYELFVGATNNSGQSNGTEIVGPPAQTWAELEYWTVIGGQSNGGETYDAATDLVTAGAPNWSHSAGDYGQLCSATLAWCVINQVPNASQAFDYLTNAGAPYDNLSSFQADPTFDLVA